MAVLPTIYRDGHVLPSLVEQHSNSSVTRCLHRCFICPLYVSKYSTSQRRDIKCVRLSGILNVLLPPPLPSCHRSSNNTTDLWPSVSIVKIYRLTIRCERSTSLFSLGRFLRGNFSKKLWGWRGQKNSLDNFVRCTIWWSRTVSYGGSYGNKIFNKNLDLTQDFPDKISFHFLWVKMLPKNLPKIFRYGRKYALLAKSWAKIFKWQPIRKS